MKNTKIIGNISHIGNILNLFLIELMLRFPVNKFLWSSKLCALIETKADRESFSETIQEGEILETCWSSTSLCQSKSFQFFFFFLIFDKYGLSVII